jgi:hypothetical protein
MGYRQWPAGAEHGARQPNPPGVQVETRAPARESKIESEVLVPLFLTGISAAVAMLAVGLGCLIFNWPLDSILIAGGVTLLGMWLWRGVLRSEALLWTRERITQHDINGDGQVGKPHDVTLFDTQNWAPPARRAQPAVGGTATKRALSAFVVTCYVMGQTSERAHGIRPWQRGRYKDFRDALLRLGLAQWRDNGNHQLGWELAASQTDALRAIEAHVL